MANEDKKDFNAMSHDNKDMPKFQIITDQKSIEKYESDYRWEYTRILCKIEWRRFYRTDYSRNFRFYCGVGELSTFRR